MITRTLTGSGECAEKGWVLLGLSIAGWTLVFFVAMIVAAFALVRRD
ncbi:MAG: disulfide bond formation protein B [Betaproteobacteria bacterium]